MSVKKKKELNDLGKVELLVNELGQMEVMRLLGYVSVQPLYYWRKTEKIPHWTREKINILFKEKIN